MRVLTTRQTAVTSDVTARIDATGAGASASKISQYEHGPAICLPHKGVRSPFRVTRRPCNLRGRIDDNAFAEFVWQIPEIPGGRPVVCKEKQSWAVTTSHRADSSKVAKIIHAGKVDRAALQSVWDPRHPLRCT